MPTLPSRLTAFPRALSVDSLKVAPLSFRRLGEQMLITEEGGRHAVLATADFERFLKGEVMKDEPLWKDLQAKGFVKDHLDFRESADKALARRLLAWSGPSVHRVAVTQRRFAGDRGADMSLETARAVVDWAFRSPAAELEFEVAGGAPLLNWPAARFLFAYARRRAEASARKITLSMDADAALLDDAVWKVLKELKVRLRFDLDGPAALHDALAAAWGGADHARTCAWIRKAVEASSGEHEGFVPKPRVSARVARRSLGFERALVEEYARLGVEDFSFEYIDAASRSAATEERGASPEEFTAFYRAAFDHVVKLGLKGKKLKEARAARLLARILGDQFWAYPSAEPLDRIGWASDGALTLFDPGAQAPAEETLRAGTSGTPINEVLASPAAKAGLTASQLEGQPLCSQCVYRPYCTQDPSVSLASQGTLWGETPSNERCRVYMGVLDHLFQRAQEWEPREKLFKGWLETAA